jgi:hypothetical protein
MPCGDCNSNALAAQAVRARHAAGVYGAASCSFVRHCKNVHTVRRAAITKPAAAFVNILNAAGRLEALESHEHVHGALSTGAVDTG